MATGMYENMVSRKGIVAVPVSAETLDDVKARIIPTVTGTAKIARLNMEILTEIYKKIIIKTKKNFACQTKILIHDDQ